MNPLELEVLRSSPPPENFASALSPCVDSIPSPAPLIFTPKQLSLNCSNCDSKMTPEHQCEAIDSESNWEDYESEHDGLESEGNLYPALDLDSEDWAERFTESIRRFHG